MEKETNQIAVGKRNSADIIFWLVMPDDLAYIDDMYNQLVESVGRDDFCIYPIVVRNWNADLSPWQYNNGKRMFEGKACDFLENILEGYKNIKEKYPTARFILGGYSMAGMFALWCGYKTDVFRTIVSCSGSFWFPGFVEKYKEKKTKAESVYISLGNKEKRCRDSMMAEIENRTVNIFESLKCSKKEFVLEKGNHFTECRERMIRGFAWALNIDCESLN